MLHVLLRCVAHLYWHTCQKHCTSADDIEELHAFMKQQLGVTVSSKKRLTKNQDQVNIGKRKESFIGAECLLLLEQYPKLLDFMYDTQLKGKRLEEKEKARKAWEMFDVMWKLITGCRLPGERTLRACTIGVILITIQLFDSRRGNLYHHQRMYYTITEILCAMFLSLLQEKMALPVCHLRKLGRSVES